SYATHGEHLIPVYVFYSMFGFQRTGDQFWQMGDQLARGFVLGATAGRTTLTGEGLQHADGHSQLLASTNPAVVAYDPAFGYEIAHIVKDGLRRMYGPDSEDVFYYLTVYNEPIQHPAEPADVDAEGPFVAVSDWMRAVPDQISRWVPGTWQSLGADGFGFADTRGAARRFFHIDAQSIVLGVLTELAREGKIDRSVLKQAIDRYQL